MKELRVVKVGGSLLTFPGLAPALQDWLARQTPLGNVLIAGGGLFADAIRAAQSRFALSDETAHWLCIDALSVTARLLAAILPEAQLWGEGGAVKPGETIVLDPAPFLLQCENGHCEPLPHDWSVTSDSIAARLAEALSAKELVLLKSSPGIAFATREAAAQAEYVDAYFPRAAARVRRVRCVDLRDTNQAEVVWNSL